MADEPQAERDVVEPDVAETESEPESGVPSEEPESPLELEAEVAADYLEELLDIADLDGDIDTYIEGRPRSRVDRQRISGSGRFSR